MSASSPSRAARLTSRDESKYLSGICGLSIDKAREAQGILKSFALARILPAKTIAKDLYMAARPFSAGEITLVVMLLKFSAGNTVDQSTTMDTITKHYTDNGWDIPDIPSPQDLNIALPSVPAAAPAAAAAPAPAATPAPAPAAAPVAKADRLPLPELPKFDGDDENWVQWEITMTTALSRTEYKHYIESKKAATYSAEMDKQFYNLLLSLVRNGIANFLVVEHENHGQAAWNRMVDFYENTKTKSKKRWRVEKEISNMVFDGTGGLQQHINKLILATHELKSTGVTYTDDQRK